ncbi:MAG: AAA family ATPase, partial [Candidatus Aminicenantes bacterium]|nr:AAA family ATPase [Candidatus Aminicenantes bacterium]
NEKHPQEETFDISEFTDITMRPIRWLWYPIAPVGMVGTVLGEPGIGKTFLLADLAARVSSGRPLPVYRKPTDQVVHGWVIYITSEGVPDQILKPRLYAAGADMANITLIKGIMTKEGDYDLLDIRHHLVPLVGRIKRDNRKCVLTIIDPIASFVSGKTNLNDSAQTRHALDAVARFAENADVAVLVAIHPNKDESLKLMSRASGSIQMSAAVKTAWVVADPKEDDPQNMRYFSPYKIATVPFNKKEALPFFLEPADFKHDEKTIEMANLRWSAETVICDIEKIISPRANEAGVNQTAKACAMLKDALKNGPRFSDELFALAKSLGIGDRPLYAAKAKLAIKASPEHFSGKWKWIPPDTWPEGEGNVRE